MQKLSQAKRLIDYYFKAKTHYQVDSPFVFDFVQSVLEDDRWFYPFSEVEPLRQQLLQDSTQVNVTDFGAGSRVSLHKKRAVKDLARYSATTPHFCRILFRIVQHYKPKKLVELGTSLGISSLYQSQAALNGTLHTLEGCPEISKLAKRNFKQMQTSNIRLHTGKFEDTLPGILNELGQLDYVFIDGNHREKPTLAYFETCLKYAHNDTIFIFDDIHWSDEMEAAWAAIKAHSRTQLTIDLFKFAVVFIRQEQQKKEHFVLAPSKWKPWQMGFFR